MELKLCTFVVGMEIKVDGNGRSRYEIWRMGGDRCSFCLCAGLLTHTYTHTQLCVVSAIAVAVITVVFECVATLVIDLLLLSKTLKTTSLQLGHGFWFCQTFRDIFAVL